MVSPLGNEEDYRQLKACPARPIKKRFHPAKDKQTIFGPGTRVAQASGLSFRASGPKP